jgi:hypothetical protein
MDALPPESCWQGLCNRIAEEADNSKHGVREYLPLVQRKRHLN